MARVISVGIADIPYKAHQSEAKDFIYQMFSRAREDMGRLINVFDNSAIESRHFTQPKEWFGKPHSFVERNKLYLNNALTLSLSAANHCIEKTNAELSDFDHIIFVSSTGIATPTIDALLINKLKLDTHLRRTPIWGLGCVGGAVGLSRAFEYTRAFPKSAVLVIALEICSLAFLKDDYSKSNIIATALFSDGAAAVLVAGREHKLFRSTAEPLSSNRNEINGNSLGINFIDSLSTTYYDSLDIMGWEIVDAGFKAIFSKDIPMIVRKYVRENIEELLDRHNLKLGDLKHFVIHPGGLKVIEAYEESLGLANGTFGYSRKVLREHGNMSSPTVLYVLKEFLDEGKYRYGDYGLISALGPGFSSELILFKVDK
ncbi:MAG TPA: 3-oxoacyl-[acyl-carrier-protein] synthase III C-terminal domain-containing protein [Thermodesulfobacteriota bacterium]|nr:3-oxoacyl-[acyl-carrier-protein] synthase III C-terminal domain-containing protein [Thermodesulfobacteriota bacterium]